MNALVTVPQFNITDIERVALAIAKGGLFGSNDPNAVLTLCLLAQAEGQHPAVVFRDYHIIQGKPAKKAEAMLRDFISSGGKVEWHSLTDEIADATFSHPAGGTIRIDWTMKRAQQANISTPMWKKYPRQMLRSRVISEGVRSVCPSATSGLYEVDEVRDIVAEQGGEVIEVVAKEPPPRTNWGGRYPNRMALRKARVLHHGELERLGIEGTFDDLDGYLTSPEYQDYISLAAAHFPYWLEGDIPAELAEQMPPEYIQTFALESKVRDMIAIRGNIAMEPEELQ